MSNKYADNYKITNCSPWEELIGMQDNNGWGKSIVLSTGCSGKNS